MRINFVVKVESSLTAAIRKPIDRVIYKNCIHYMREAFKFLKPAFNQEDFI